MDAYYIDAYTFTRPLADFTAKVQVEAYNPEVVAKEIIKTFHDYGRDRDYNISKSVFLDTTMSCDEKEAKAWLKYYMDNAIAYGIETGCRDWRSKFLAAWNLYKEF